MPASTSSRPATTSGTNSEIIEELDGDAPILRPANYPPGSPGRGIVRRKGLTVINLQGRTFMAEHRLPLPRRRRACSKSSRRARSSSTCTPRRRARRWRWAGTSTAASRPSSAPTPTCPTADTRILPKGTAYVTDAGMSGARDSVLGFEVAASHRLFLTGMPTRLPVEEKSPRNASSSTACMIDIDDATGHRRTASIAARYDRRASRACRAKADFHNHSTASDGS